MPPRLYILLYNKQLSMNHTCRARTTFLKWSFMEFLRDITIQKRPWNAFKPYVNYARKSLDNSEAFLTSSKKNDTHDTNKCIKRKLHLRRDLERPYARTYTYKIVWQQLYVHRLVIKQQHGDLFSSFALVSILFIQISTLIEPRHSYQSGRN